MRSVARQGVAIVTAAAALAAAALLVSPLAAAATTDSVLLSNPIPEIPGGLGEGSLSIGNSSGDWLGFLVNAPNGGTITTVTFSLNPIPLDPAKTNVWVFADRGGVPDFTLPPSSVLTYASTSSDGSTLTYTGSVTVAAGPFWIGIAIDDGLISGSLATVASGNYAEGPWTFGECPTDENPGPGTCGADGNGSSLSPRYPAEAYPIEGIWPKMGIYGVLDEGSPNANSPVTRIEYLQQVPVPGSGDCLAVDDAEFAWNTGLTGGWKPSWAQWAKSGRGGPICTRTLVNDGSTWVLE